MDTYMGMEVQGRYELCVNYSILTPGMIPEETFRFIHTYGIELLRVCPSLVGVHRKKFILCRTEGIEEGLVEQFLLDLEETGADLHSLIAFAVQHHDIAVSGPNITGPGVYIRRHFLGNLYYNGYPCVVNLGGGFCGLYDSGWLDIQGKWRFLIEDRS